MTILSTACRVTNEYMTFHTPGRLQSRVNICFNLISCLWPMTADRQNVGTNCPSLLTYGLFQLPNALPHYLWIG